MGSIGIMSEKRYKCPKCKSPLVYHHEDKETVTFECKNCNHFVLASDTLLRLLVCIAVSHRGLTDEEWQFMRRLEKELFDDE